MEALHLQPDLRRVPGAHRQELGFDLALLPSFYGFLAALFTFTMWVMLQTLNDEVPKYRDQIPSPGLMVFPNH